MGGEDAGGLGVIHGFVYLSLLFHLVGQIFFRVERKLVDVSWGSGKVDGSGGLTRRGRVGCVSVMRGHVMRGSLSATTGQRADIAPI